MLAGDQQKVDALEHLRNDNLRALPAFEFSATSSCWTAKYPVVQREDVFSTVDRLLNYQAAIYPGVTAQVTAKFLIHGLLLIGVGENPLGSKTILILDHIMNHVMNAQKPAIRDVPLPQLLDIRQRLREKKNTLLVLPEWVSQEGRIFMQMMPVLTREILKNHEEGDDFSLQKLVITRSGKMQQWYPKERRWGWTTKPSHFNAQGSGTFCCACVFQFEPDDAREAVEYWGLDHNCKLHFLKGTENNLLQLPR
ncbi:MAG: hypothetical protein ACR2PX_14945 [Endozoicomonas sp.]